MVKKEVIYVKVKLHCFIVFKSIYYKLLELFSLLTEVFSLR